MIGGGGKNFSALVASRTGHVAELEMISLSLCVSGMLLKKRIPVKPVIPFYLLGTSNA
jgi:hypothetical protein